MIVAKTLANVRDVEREKKREREREREKERKRAEKRSMKRVHRLHGGDRVAAYGPESASEREKEKEEREREKERGRGRSICSRTLYSATCHVQGNLVPGSPGEGHGVAISA